MVKQPMCVRTGSPSRRWQCLWYCIIAPGPTRLSTPPADHGVIVDLLQLRDRLDQRGVARDAAVGVGVDRLELVEESGVEGRGEGAGLEDEVVLGAEELHLPDRQAGRRGRGGSDWSDLNTAGEPALSQDAERGRTCESSSSTGGWRSFPAEGQEAGPTCCAVRSSLRMGVLWA